MILKKNVLV